MTFFLISCGNKLEAIKIDNSEAASVKGDTSEPAAPEPASTPAPAPAPAPVPQPVPNTGTNPTNAKGDFTKVPGATANLIYENDAESGRLMPKESYYDGGTRFPPENYVSNIMGVSGDVARNGNKSWFFRMNKADWVNNPRIPEGYHPRCHISKLNDVNGRMIQDQEYWLGWSIYFPKDYVVEKTPRAGTVLMEFKGVGGSNIMFPLSLSLDIDNDGVQRYGFFSRRDGEYQNGWTQSWLYHWGDNVFPPKGVWIDYVVRLNISLKSTGYIEIWERVNGGTLKKVTSYNGVTTYWGSDGKPPKSSDYWYMVYGDYKAKIAKLPVTAPDNTTYYDEFRVAKGSGGGILVDPEEYK